MMSLALDLPLTSETDDGIFSVSAPHVDIVHDISPEIFRRDYVERGRPCVIRLGEGQKPPQYGWSFAHLSAIAGDMVVPVYDWGSDGPTVEDKFRIIEMPLRDALAHASRVTQRTEQQLAICQLPVENCGPVEQEFRDPDFLAHTIAADTRALPAPFSERRRNAIFISVFRGIHWHNGRDALAQICEGGKRFILFSPDQTRYLYPKRFMDSPIAWFDETEAVFCSDIPFEDGLDVDLCRFPLFAKAQPIIADVKAGDALYIPTHWWHFTAARSPSVVVVSFWDAPLRRWHFPLAWRSVLMKPFRKFLFRPLRRLRPFSRTERR